MQVTSGGGAQHTGQEVTCTSHFQTERSCLPACPLPQDKATHARDRAYEALAWVDGDGCKG